MDVADGQKGTSMSEYERLKTWRRPHSPEPEEVFTQAVIDLKEILVLDGIDHIPDRPGFRIRSDTGKHFEVLDRVSIGAAKLLAITNSRQIIERLFPDCKFLPPTSTDDTKVDGIRVGPLTILAEAATWWEAYGRSGSDSWT
ncbi:MAG TPA: hypothetical protein VE398_24345 [Acidobacteriota bacterium]|nr:hypothetical protein [Acidobacteriota bacterium]